MKSIKLEWQTDRGDTVTVEGIDLESINYHTATEEEMKLINEMPKLQQCGFDRYFKGVSIVIGSIRLNDEIVRNRYVIEFAPYDE